MTNPMKNPFTYVIEQDEPEIPCTAVRDGGPCGQMAEFWAGSCHGDSFICQSCIDYANSLEYDFVCNTCDRVDTGFFPGAIDRLEPIKR